jgi:hypothetical protein
MMFGAFLRVPFLGKFYMEEAPEAFEFLKEGDYLE